MVNLPPGPPRPVAPQLPNGWKAHWNTEYRAWFYENIYTEDSVWELPTQPVYPPHAEKKPPPGPPPGYITSASISNPADIPSLITSMATTSISDPNIQQRDKPASAVNRYPTPTLAAQQQTYIAYNPATPSGTKSQYTPPNSQNTGTQYQPFNPGSSPLAQHLDSSPQPAFPQQRYTPTPPPVTTPYQQTPQIQSSQHRVPCAPSTDGSPQSPKLQQTTQYSASTLPVTTSYQHPLEVQYRSPPSPSNSYQQSQKPGPYRVPTPPASQAIQLAPHHSDPSPDQKAPSMTQQGPGTPQPPACGAVLTPPPSGMKDPGQSASTNVRTQGVQVADQASTAYFNQGQSAQPSLSGPQGQSIPATLGQPPVQYIYSQQPPPNIALGQATKWAPPGPGETIPRPPPYYEVSPGQISMPARKPGSMQTQNPYSVLPLPPPPPPPGVQGQHPLGSPLPPQLQYGLPPSSAAPLPKKGFMSKMISGKSGALLGAGAGILGGAFLKHEYDEHKQEERRKYQQQQQQTGNGGFFSSGSTGGGIFGTDGILGFGSGGLPVVQPQIVQQQALQPIYAPQPVVIENVYDGQPTYVPQTVVVENEVYGSQSVYVPQTFVAEINGYNGQPNIIVENNTYVNNEVVDGGNDIYINNNSNTYVGGGTYVENDTYIDNSSYVVNESYVDNSLYADNSTYTDNNSYIQDGTYVDNSAYVQNDSYTETDIYAGGCYAQGETEEYAAVEESYSFEESFDCQDYGEF